MQEVPFEVTLVSRLITNPGMVLREEEDGAALLYDPETGAVRILNGSATAIWKLLDGKRSLADVVAALRETYDGMDEQAEGQVLAVVKNLCALGAVGTLTELA
jgi:hypothetical protein